VNRMSCSSGETGVPRCLRNLEVEEFRGKRQVPFIRLDELRGNDVQNGVDVVQLESKGPLGSIASRQQT
jgi:hypothetical protein